jgi:biotin carboxylase
VIAADDDGAIIAARACEALGFPHHGEHAVRTARDKHRMREAFRAAGVAGPSFRLVSVRDDPAAQAARTDYPCVLKPLHLSASRGVIRADDPAGFVEAFGRIVAILETIGAPPAEGAAAGHLLVEAFVSGVEVAVEGIVTDGRVRVLAVYDKPDSLDGPYFEETLYVTPSRHAAGDVGRIMASVQQAVSALGLRHGPIHAEVRFDADGVWPIEIAPRSIGGLCSRTLRFGERASLEELILRHALGRQIGGLQREPGSAGVMMIPIPHRGVLLGVRGVGEAEAVDGVEEVRLVVPVGQVVVPPPEGSRYMGFIFARAAEPAEAESALRSAHALLEFEIEPRSGVPRSSS